MLIRIKEIYNRVHEKTDTPMDLIQSVGTCVLDHLRECLSDPEEIGYDLRKVGSFNVRQGRYLEMMNTVLRAISEGRPPGNTLEKQKVMMTKIIDYKVIKKQSRQKRYEEIKSKQSNQSIP